jgi:Pyruvate/2-oxoacid:ferredoxin oxidoreductase gamma subunit
MMRKDLGNGIERAFIVLCGEAGQGIQTVERFLKRVFKLSGYHICH